jgi:endonuclease G
VQAERIKQRPFFFIALLCGRDVPLANLVALSAPFCLSLDPPGPQGPVSDHLRRLAYTTAYDRRLRIPAWTAEHLTKDSLKGSGTRAESVFKEDESIPPMFRAHLLDYFRSGYGEGSAWGKVPS